MLARYVHPGVEHSAVGVGDFNHAELVRVKGFFRHGLHGYRVNGRAWESIASLLDGNVDRCCGLAGHGQGRTAPIHVDVRDRGVVFPRERIFVLVLPEPLLPGDLHVVRFGVIGNDPHLSVGRESKDDEPRYDDGWQDVEKHLELGVVPIDGKRPHFDVVDVRGVRFNAFSIPQHGQKQPAEGEDADQNGPKHELIIENREYRVFCYHAITPIDRPLSPSLSVP